MPFGETSPYRFLGDYYFRFAITNEFGCTSYSDTLHLEVISDHIVNPANDKITIEVHGEPGSGNANHLYAVYGFHTANNPDADTETKDDTSLKILFTITNK